MDEGSLGLPPLQAPSRSLNVKVALRVPVRKLGKYMLANHKPFLSALAQRSPALKSLLMKTEADLRLMPNTDDIERFKTRVSYSMGRAAKLGYKPATDVESGIAMTANWAKLLMYAN